MNIEHRMGKDEETEFKKPELLDEKKPRLGVVECSVLGVCFFIRSAGGGQVLARLWRVGII